MFVTIFGIATMLFVLFTLVVLGREHTRNTARLIARNTDRPIHRNTDRPIPRRAPDPFQIRVRSATCDYDDSSLAVFEVRMRGILRVPCDDYPIHHILTASDVTDGDMQAKPILCAIDALQAPESTNLFWCSDKLTIPYRESVMSDWVKLLSVPIDALLFPAGGSRRLKFKVSILSAFGDIEISSAEHCVRYENEARGYLDFKDDWQRTGELGVQLAIAASAADGEMVKDEMVPISDWILSRASSVDEDDQSQSALRNRWRRAARSAHELVKAESLNVREICAELVNIASPADRYDILELCLTVARADGTATKQELNHVYTLAEQLDIDETRFRTMVDKALPVSMHEQHDPMRILGIDVTMSADEIKRHLRMEFKKWNARVTHSDAKIRGQAEEMLSLIAQTRSKLDRQGTTI